MPPRPLMLHAESNAVDAGLRLPNINDDYTGERLDMGVLERGREEPRYGVRWRERPL
jgi:hypothetical protein